MHCVMAFVVSGRKKTGYHVCHMFGRLRYVKAENREEEEMPSSSQSGLPFTTCIPQGLRHWPSRSSFIHLPPGECLVVIHMQRSVVTASCRDTVPSVSTTSSLPRGKANCLPTRYKNFHHARSSLPPSFLTNKHNPPSPPLFPAIRSFFAPFALPSAPSSFHPFPLHHPSLPVNCFDFLPAVSKDHCPAGMFVSALSAA